MPECRITVPVPVADIVGLAVIDSFGGELLKQIRQIEAMILNGKPARLYCARYGFVHCIRKAG
jgi:hypothetical protein